MVKQSRHRRRYKSGHSVIINPFIRNFSSFPLGREKDMQVKWNKRKLKTEYEAHELFGEGTNPSRTLYETSAIGIKTEDPESKEYIYKKVPYERLPHIAKIESNLIRGGFMNMKTGKIIPPYKVKDE